MSLVLHPWLREPPRIAWREAARRVASLTPKGLYARSILIVILPMVILQSVITFIFLERHWALVTNRLSTVVTQDLAAIIAIYQSYPQHANLDTLTRIAQDRNALDLLVGRPTTDGELADGLGEGRATLADLPAGLSSDVLLRRPDVLDAEHQLIAAHANIGAARAARFPTISLTAAVGTLSTALGGLFAGGSFTYEGAPSIALPLFDGGRITANIRLAEAQRTAALANYDKAVQTAFREVADALAQRGTIGRQIDAQRTRAESATVAANLSNARYRAGVDSFLNTLDSQRTAYAAQQQLVTTRLARADNLVELYRSLGGGLR